MSNFIPNHTKNVSFFFNFGLYSRELMATKALLQIHELFLIIQVGYKQKYDWLKSL